MCGIAGIVGAPAPDPNVLEAMAAAMAARGPDGQGIWAGEGCGLAFRRLAIIDLSPAGQSPSLPRSRRRKPPRRSANRPPRRPKCRAG